MRLKMLAVSLALAGFASAQLGAQKPEKQIPHLDHVFLIMMENHSYSEVIGNPNAPFLTAYAKQSNLATNYFGVGHPSLTNYLEVVGGSNFGVINDHAPDWHSANCMPNIVTGVPSDESTSSDICPISGAGYDAPTPAVDTTNEGTPSSPVYNDPLPSAFTEGKTIADQLVSRGMTWKSYQENLPPYGADRVNSSDGLISNTTASEPGMPQLYAVKHNPFAYFASVQNGTGDKLSLDRVVGFDQLYKDLNRAEVPNFLFIAPNQCHDQHGRGSNEVGPGCSVDSNVIAAGDSAVATLVKAIKSSTAWKHGNNVLIVVWDENDYGTDPNQVVLTVDTNYAPTGITSNVKYNHFSLLKTMEAGFGLNYLNHAADPNVKLMSDLFGVR